MKKVIKDILGNVNTKENLPLYVKEMMNSYNRFSLIKLSMNYYTYFEMLREGGGSKALHVNYITEEINSIIKDIIVNDEFDENAVEKINDLRNDVISKTEILTTYADIFSIYEHALNRVEHNFSEYELPEKYDDESFCRQIMQYILDTNDNVVINSKISEILRQLPIRITKSKFFNMLEEAFSIYKGSPANSLDDFIYMIRSCAMLNEPKDFKNEFFELDTVYEDFSKIDFKEMTKEKYQNSREKLYYVTDYLQDIMGKYMMLEELVNDLYIIILSLSYAEPGKELNACSMIITSVNTDFEENKDEATDVDDLFIMLEGRQESLYEKITKDNVIADIANKYDDIILESGLSQEFHALKQIDKLSSDSIFIDLEEKDNTKIADDEYINSSLSKLTEEFGNLFNKNGKNINRAVMSVVISELPVFFNNITELQDYIYNALTGCRNIAEKKACVEIISQIIGEN